MFTQCPACQTVFKLSAETLRAAAGEVRCGRCAEQFNALRSLAEDPQAFASMQVPQALPQTLASGTIGAALPLPEPQPDVVFADPEPDETASPTLADDPSLAFTLPPGEIDRIFVEARPYHFAPRRGPLALQGREGLVRQEPQASPGPAPEAELPPVQESSTPASDAAPDESTLLPEPDQDPSIPVQESFHPPASEGLAPEQWLDQALLTRSAPDLVPPRRTGRTLWIAGGVVLALIFAAQLVHHFRGELAQASVIGNPLRALYAMTGHPIELPMNLSAFEIRPWGVTGDTSADGVLRVRASLINNAAEPQPWPLLRLKLEDRFGARVGARDFLPAEYLHRTPPRILGPGERADLLIEVVDPGKSAEGFELDVCEGRAGARVVCANDPPAGAPPR